MYDLKKAGLYRANPFANSENATRLVHRSEPGTPAQDAGTVDLTGATTIQGIVYDGTYLPFSHEEDSTQALREYTLSSAATAMAIQDAVHQLTDRREVDGIVTVTRSGNSLTITHTGAGTVSALVVDGSNQALTRSAITVAGVGVSAAEAGGTPDERTGAKTDTGKNVGGTEATDDAGKLAAGANLDIATITGTGKDGRVLVKDVQAAINELK